MSRVVRFSLILLVSLAGCEQASQVVEQAANSERHTAEAQCLEEIGRAMLAHNTSERAFPPAAICADDGSPLLSWRVVLLAYLPGGQGLYGQFHLDEAWDSPHNSQLISQMPEIYARVGSAADGTTRAMVFTGEAAPFDGSKQSSFRDVTDGTHNTILCVVAGADKAVPWTKPEDLPVDPSNPLGPLGQPDGDFFTAVFFDGIAKRIPRTTDPVELCNLINNRDGTMVNSYAPALR